MLKLEQMKKLSTTSVLKTKTAATKITLVSVAVLLAVATPLQVTRVAQADRYDDRINAIQKEIDEYQAKAGTLKDQADSLQKEMDAITAQKNIIQKQIDLKQAEHDKLTADIAENERKITKSQDVLGETIARLYVDDKISPLEMLASSQNIGDFVDKQSYRTAVRDQLTDSITQIRTLKKKLEEQKKDVERVLAEEKLARNALADKENEQAELVNKTRGEESAYRSLTATREQQKLEAQQAQQAAIQAAMAAAGGGGSVNILPGDPNKGGYPWEAGCYVDANAWSHGGPNGNGTDALGYGCRQCVSYTAAKVGIYTKGDAYKGPSYWGNANQWPGSARASGYATGKVPRANSVGVISAGQYGHVVWIEAVNGDGTVDISQYNYLNAGGPGWGHYSKMRVPAATYDTYIYF